MKICKVYSNKNFKNIEFHNGFNVVIAYIKSKKKEDTHNLGKTSLITVLDFLLLSKYSKSDKLLGNKIFKGQKFYLELELNSGKYLLIKREIDDPTKISFKLYESKLKQFSQNISFDIQLTFDKAKNYLCECLGFDILQKFSYRQPLSYFLRSQQDYLDVFKLKKFLGPQKNWKPFVFELLGFDSGLMKGKFDLDDKIEEQKKKIKIIQSEADFKISEKDKLVSLLEVKRNSLESAKKNIDKFNFYEEDIKTNKSIVETIDSKLQAFLSDRYRITYEISKIKESLDGISEHVDSDNITSLFQEVNLYYPQQLKKKYEDLIEFQRAITSERIKYLSKNLQKCNTEKLQLDREIEGLEEKKSDLLSLLTQKDSYSKFKEYQKVVLDFEVEVKRIEDKLNLMDSTLIYKNDITELKKKLDIQVEMIKNAFLKREHSNINRIFDSIIKEVLGVDATISLKLNKYNNVDFQADYQNKFDLLKTSESEGTSYKKLLCVAFDLALLINYSNRSFYRFSYHDGVFEGLDDRIKVRFIQLLKKYCKEYDIQCVVSLIDSDIPKGNSDLIKQGDFCLELNDNDDQGKLFNCSF